MKKNLYFLVIILLGAAANCCFAAGEIRLDEPLKNRITVPELLRGKISYRDRARRFMEDRDRIHTLLKQQGEKSLKNYLFEHQDAIKGHLNHKQIAEIVKEFKADALTKRKRHIFLVTRFLRTNYRKWYDKYKKKLFKQGKSADKSKGRNRKKNIKKFENLMWEAENRFAKRYKETKNAYLYALNRAKAKIGKVEPPKKKEIPEPPPLPEFKKKPVEKPKVSEETIPEPPPVPEFEKRKKSALEWKLKREVEKRKREMRGEDVGDDNGEKGEVFDIVKTEVKESEIEEPTREEMIERTQSQELLKEIREFKQRGLTPVSERKLVPKKEEKPKGFKRWYQDIAKQSKILQETEDVDEDDDETWEDD